jgi:hypothetical protein
MSLLRKRNGGRGRWREKKMNKNLTRRNTFRDMTARSIELKEL